MTQQVKKQTIAIYPGSFNPFTTGHLNILEKSEAIFGKDNVIIAVGVNPEKLKAIAIPNQMGTTAIGHVPMDRAATIKLNLPSKNIEEYSGFLTDYIWEKEKAGFDVVVIRGLRNGDDFDYEVNQLRFMQEMKPDVKVIFINCDKEFEHISSSAYRMLEAVKQGAGHRYLAKEIYNWVVITDFQSADKYASVEDKPQNAVYLQERERWFVGSLEECKNWKKQNPYKEVEQ